MTDNWLPVTIEASGDFANMRAQPSVASTIVAKLTTPQDAQLDLLNILTEAPANPAALRWFHFRQETRSFWLRSDVVHFINPLEARVQRLEDVVNQIQSQHSGG